MSEGNPSKPYMPQNPFGVEQRYWERLQRMRLLDDALMTAALDNNIKATQLILRIILEKEDLIITGVKTQPEYKNLYGRSIWLDVEAADSSGVKYDIEIQRDERGANPERARYHSAMMDAKSLKSRQNFSELPTTYVLFITETDYWEEGLSLYHFDRTMRETGRDFGDRAHIIYANGAYRGEDSIGLLMADFRESNPGEMHYPELAERVNALKNSEDEVKKMCQAMEITYQEGHTDGLRDGTLKTSVRSLKSLMKKMGLSVEEAMDTLEIPEDDRQACVEYMTSQSDAE